MPLVDVLVREIDVEIDDADGSFGRLRAARGKLGKERAERAERKGPGDASNHAGSLPGFHLMLQPMLAFCSALGDLPASRASTARRASMPVTGASFFGRASSNCPRYASFPRASKM